VGGLGEVGAAFFRGLFAFGAVAFLGAEVPSLLVLADRRPVDETSLADPAEIAAAVSWLSSFVAFLDFLGTVLEIFIELASLSRFASSFCESLA
jgi:hypothetical protein